MLWFLLFVMTIIIVNVVIVVSYYLFHTRYYNFVKTHSKAIKEITKLNKNYRFEVVNNPKLTHTYDNGKMYDSVSCYNYLVYDLQFPNNRQLYLDIINKANNNQYMYTEYLNNIKNIQFGLFDIDSVKLNVNKLISIEKELVKTRQLKPITKFKLDVILCYVNMGGRLISRKSCSFGEYEVCHTIDLLNDRNGRFYNNREIWDSLCCVERAKVSNKMRFSIYARDGYRCRMCHRRYNTEYLEIDHIYPISKGGKSTYENLQTLCKKCNKEKSNKII